MRSAFSRMAAAAVGAVVTTPARIVARSGVRVVRPSATTSSTAPDAGTSASTVWGTVGGEAGVCAVALPAVTAIPASVAAFNIPRI